MTESIKHIVRHLHSVETMQEIAHKAALSTTIRAVQSWQCQRLMHSHQAMYQQYNFKPAFEFFIHELYGPNDFSQRDNDIKRLVPKMARFMPDKTLQSLASALHLNALSFELDFAMAKQLKDTTLNRDTYLQAYRACDNPNDRQQQIHLMEVVGNDLAELVKMRGIATLLLLTAKPAEIAGLHHLHHFIAAGYQAFKNIGNIDTFILPIVHFEQGLKDQMFDLAMPNPLPTVFT